VAVQKDIASEVTKAVRASIEGKAASLPPAH